MQEAREDEVKSYGLLDKYAFITSRAYDQNFVGYCYREYTDIKIDSGWRFLFGDEDEEYLDNPDNSLTMDLSDLMEWKPELSSVIEERYNSEFEWNREENKFEQLF